MAQRLHDEYHLQCHACQREVAIPCHQVTRAADGEQAVCPYRDCGAALILQWRPAAEAA